METVRGSTRSPPVGWLSCEVVRDGCVCIKDLVETNGSPVAATWTCSLLDLIPPADATIRVKPPPGPRAWSALVKHNRSIGRNPVTGGIGSTVPWGMEHTPPDVPG